MKKINKYLKLVFLSIIFILAIGAIQDISVNAAVLSNQNREKSDDSVTIQIKGVSDLDKKYDTYIYYSWEDANGSDFYDYISDKIPSRKLIKISKKAYEYKFKFDEQGKYKIFVKYRNKKNSSDSGKTNKITAWYDNSKPLFEIPSDLKGAYKLYEFKNYVKKDGNDYYYKGTNADILVRVQSRSPLKKVTCLVDGKMVAIGSYQKEEAKTEIKKYEFKINGEVDGKLSFFAENANGTSKNDAGGAKIIIDNTKPEIKYSDQYEKGAKTVYSNKPVEIPIEITEKHFDKDNTKVLVDGKAISTTWNSNGDKNTTSIKVNNGEHVVTVTSTDKAGNASNEVESAKIVVDETAPEVKVSGIVNGKSYGNRDGEYTPYTITVDINDNYISNNQSATLYKLNEKDKKIIKKIDFNSIQKGNAYELTCGDITEDGYYRLEVIANDKAGNKVTAKSLKKQGQFEVKKGKVVGYFYINRNGSKYEIDENSKQFFGTTVKEVEDIVIYEYNINNIKDENKAVTLITSQGNKILQEYYEYFWDDVSSEMGNETYPYVYRYTIAKENFNNGLYSIKITSSAEVLGDGNSSLKVEASSDGIVNQVINVDNKEPNIITFERTGTTVYVHICDDNLNEDSVQLKIANKSIKLEQDKSMTTSTNFYYTANVGDDISNVELKCSDNAGNESSIKELQSDDEKSSIAVMIIIISAAAIFLVTATIVIIVLITKKQR